MSGGTLERKAKTDFTQETYDKIATSWDTRYPDVSHLQQLLDAFASYRPDGRVLDAGCATGACAQYFLDRSYHVTGVDYSEEMIRIAKQNHPSGDFKRADMRKLEFDDRTFDGIWCSASLHHMPKSEVSPTLEGFKRVLKPGGIAFIRVTAASGGNDEEEIVEVPGDDGKRFFSRFGEKELRGMLRKAGFVILDSYVEQDKKVESVSWLNVFAKVPEKPLREGVTLINMIKDGLEIRLPHEWLYEVKEHVPSVGAKSQQGVGLALAKVWNSDAHHHAETEEVYFVAKGSGAVSLDEVPLPLKEFDLLVIPVGTVHKAISTNGMHVLALTGPPWKQEDHHLEKRKRD